MSTENRRALVKRNLACLGLALAVAGFVYLVYLTEPVTKLDFLSTVESTLVDLRFRIRGPRVPSPDLAVVAIDGQSIREIGRWPWTRGVHARLMDQLREWQVSTVAFDILFTEEEGAQEAARLREIEATLPTDLPEAEPARVAVAAAIERALADRALAVAFEKSVDAGVALPVLSFNLVYANEVKGPGDLGNVLGGDDEQTLLDFASYPSRDANVASLRNDPAQNSIAIRPVVSALAAWCPGVGFVNPVFDVDASIRRERVYSVFSPSSREAFLAGRSVRQALLAPEARVQAFMPMPIAAVVTHLRLPVDEVVLDLPASALRLGKEGGTQRTTRFEPDGTMRIDFYGAGGTVPTYSYVDVLRGELLKDTNGAPIDGRETLKGKLVFVGATDVGLGDDFPTPFTARLPGVEKLATSASNLLQSRTLSTHASPELAIALSAVAAALLLTLIAGNLAPLTAIPVLLGTTGVALWATYREFAARGFVWNWTVPLVTLAAGFAVLTAYRQLTEERAKRQIRSVFSTYMSPAAVEDILSDPAKLKLGGERRTCTIFFSDLVGFTSLSEAMADPRDLVKLMNRYLGRMTELILAEDGILDKYIGDAIMAIFGAPRVRPDHAARGCRAALSNMKALAVLREEFKAEGLPEIDCRIGLNTGEVVIGNMGSEIRMDYTALGDPVNLASRLEGANKPYHTHIMVGPDTMTQASEHDPELVFRPLDLIAVKGKLEPVQVYELIGLKGELDDEKRRVVAAYLQALERYSAGDFAAALAAFEGVLKLDPHDGPAETYVERCRQFVAEPPPADWDGVYRMTTK